MGSHSQQQQQQSRRRQIPAAPRRQCCFSFAAYARSLMDHLRRCGVRVEPGLSETELGHLESQLGLLFPPDLRAILTEGLPAGSSFPDWRHEPAASLRARIQQPLADLCAQVRRSRFWCDKWGDRPSGGEQAAAMAAAALERVAPLVPVYGNCYIPSSGSAGNPVLLVQSGEVSVVGNDVADFFEREVFHGDQEEDPNSRLLDEEDSSSSSSCLMGSMKMGRSSDGGDRDKISSSSLWGMRSLDFAFRRKKGISRSMAGTRSAEVSPRPSQWLHGYLDDMAGRLRIAGWKEDEICEMIVLPPIDDPVVSRSSSNAIVPSNKQSRQAVIQGLVFKVQELSDSLKRSGWSVQEVAEAFNSTTLSSSPKVLPSIAAR
ncbi:hypothetical protein SELMODRAFT_82965 [Selaginella moellendorffii]|uniref:Knr4/Smi1-like domain-containing protein n=1 Tax=Selaginella moellendorffii TaxID=88036 RepID=D8R2F7_SELML|nr:hypothetical protein SELMODRAFT_82965 [Selaginella moellendorffii]